MFCFLFVAAPMMKMSAAPCWPFILRDYKQFLSLHGFLVLFLIVFLIVFKIPQLKDFC